MAKSPGLRVTKTTKEYQDIHSDVESQSDHLSAEPSDHAAVHVTSPHGDLSCSYVGDGGPPSLVHPKSDTCANCPLDRSYGSFEHKGPSQPLLDSKGLSQPLYGTRDSKETLVLEKVKYDGANQDGLGGDEDSSNAAAVEHRGQDKKTGMCGFFRCIKPLAWVIILGDGMHNLADGIALGAAISQNLGVGLSTALAILFHEIPHEIGDYVILLSTGMRWYTALLANFASALTAILGFFVGVAVGNDSQDAQDWILAVTAGQFLYIALVDLLPELVHSKQKGVQRMGELALTIIGLCIGFAVLLVIAVYEDELNSLID